MRKLFILLSVFLVGVIVAGCGGAQPTPAQPAAEPTQAAAEPTKAAEVQPASSDMTFATVVKISGITWFNRMEEGVKKFGEDTGITTFQKGPEKADAALQIPIIEDLIAQKVTALCVIPMSPEALEPVLKKAMDAGIVVITHEASSQQNMNVDIEAFDNPDYGRHLMDELAKRMGEEGEYAVFVGSLTSKTHNEWVDAAIAHQKEKYPNMTLVGDKNESYDDSQKAYEKTKELLKTYPDIKGFQGSASTDVPGIGQAVEEAGLQDKITVVGTGLPSISGDLWKTGAVDMISFWDPKEAGYACNKLAQMYAEGKTATDGMDLGIPGYNKLTLKGKVLYGQAWADATLENLDKYPF